MRVPVIDLDSLTRNWWAVALRGLAGILFGIITFVSPGISLAALVLLVTGSLAGLYPAWLAARAPIAATLRSEAT